MWGSISYMNLYNIELSSSDGELFLFILKFELLDVDELLQISDQLVVESILHSDVCKHTKELDEMKKRLKEMDKEVAALREMQAKVEKEMGLFKNFCFVSGYRYNASMEAVSKPHGNGRIQRLRNLGCGAKWEDVQP
ncbi:hypothetical protein L1887_23954 [Cichorium endivia]|nr:hypothetical protein L1887_23954 [Cichorium endivia]